VSFIYLALRVATDESPGHGYDIGVYISPYISASLEAIASTTGACPDDKSKHEFGVNIDPKFGAEIVAEAENEKDKDHPLFEVTIAVCTMLHGSRD
jgi:hypothetical protein